MPGFLRLDYISGVLYFRDYIFRKIYYSEILVAISRKIIIKEKYLYEYNGIVFGGGRVVDGCICGVSL